MNCLSFHCYHRHFQGPVIICKPVDHLSPFASCRWFNFASLWLWMPDLYLYSDIMRGWNKREQECYFFFIGIFPAFHGKEGFSFSFLPLPFLCGKENSCSLGQLSWIPKKPASFLILYYLISFWLGQGVWIWSDSMGRTQFQQQENFIVYGFI